MDKLHGAAAIVLSTVFSQHAALRLLRHIPVLVDMYQWVNATFAHRVSAEDVSGMTVGQAIDKKIGESERRGARQRLKRFLESWQHLQTAFITYAPDRRGRIPVLSMSEPNAVRLSHLMSLVRGVRSYFGVWTVPHDLCLIFSPVGGPLMVPFTCLLAGSMWLVVRRTVLYLNQSVKDIYR